MLLKADPDALSHQQAQDTKLIFVFTSIDNHYIDLPIIIPILMKENILCKTRYLSLLVSEFIIAVDAVIMNGVIST